MIMKIDTNHKNININQTISRWSLNRFKLPKARVWIVSWNPIEDWYESNNTNTYQLGQNLRQRAQLNRYKELRKNLNRIKWYESEFVWIISNIITRRKKTGTRGNDWYDSQQCWIVSYDSKTTLNKTLLARNL
jgi:hypothetical protein